MLQAFARAPRVVSLTMVSVTKYVLESKPEAPDAFICGARP